VFRASRTPHGHALNRQPIPPRILPPRASDASRTLRRKLVPYTLTRVYGTAQSSSTTIFVTTVYADKQIIVVPSRTAAA
jgi:hypothetical protein